MVLKVLCVSLAFTCLFLSTANGSEYVPCMGIFQPLSGWPEESYAYRYSYEVIYVRYPYALLKSRRASRNLITYSRYTYVSIRPRFLAQNRLRNNTRACSSLVCMTDFVRMRRYIPRQRLKNRSTVRSWEPARRMNRNLSRPAREFSPLVQPRYRPSLPCFERGQVDFGLQ